MVLNTYATLDILCPYISAVQGILHFTFNSKGPLRATISVVMKLNKEIQTEIIKITRIIPEWHYGTMGYSHGLTCVTPCSQGCLFFLFFFFFTKDLPVVLSACHWDLSSGT